MTYTPPGTRRARRGFPDAPTPPQELPLTRRELRDQERKAASRFGREAKPAKEKRTARSRDARAASGSVGAVSKGLTFVAMLFIAGMAVATSVPANAVAPSASGVPSLVAPTEKATVTVAKDAKAKSRDKAVAAPQTLAGNGIQPPAVLRDSYSSELVLKYTALSGKTNSIVLPADAGAVIWPVGKSARISDGFGWRVSPTAGASSDHQGVDFDPGNGFPIQAISAGVVRQVFPTDGDALGVHVVIDHVIDGALVSSVYGHMQVGSVKVSEGQTVNAGDIVGLVGSTGISTGPHLHFEIRPGGKDAIDPVAWLKQNANV